MARKITMFELHVEGPFFGEKPQQATKPAPDDRDISAGESDADHGRWVGLVLFMVVTSMVVSVLAWILGRRLGVDG